MNGRKQRIPLIMSVKSVEWENNNFRKNWSNANAYRC